MRKNHPFRDTMLAISRRMQRSGYSVAYTKHGNYELGVPDPPAGAAWIQFTEERDCQGMEHALGKLGLVESTRNRVRTCYELSEERGAACVVEAGDGTGYLYMSELGPVEETRVAKLGSLLESIRGNGHQVSPAKPLDEGVLNESRELPLSTWAELLKLDMEDLFKRARSGDFDTADQGRIKAMISDFRKNVKMEIGRLLRDSTKLTPKQRQLFLKLGKATTDAYRHRYDPGTAAKDLGVSQSVAERLVTLGLAAVRRGVTATERQAKYGQQSKAAWYYLTGPGLDLYKVMKD